MPRLRSSIPKAVVCVGAEDPQELIQDATVLAAKMIDRLEQRGKLDKVTPGNIAYYTVQHLKSGRRAMGSSRVDVHAVGTQLNGISKLHSMDEVIAESENNADVFELHDIINQDSEDPATQATRNLDWQTFMASLNKLETLLVECLVNGLGVREAAELGKVSYWTMRDYRNKIAQKLLEFMGADILKDIAQVPGWRNGLDCERAMLACRADRRG